MSTLMSSIDARTKQTGGSTLEVLSFSLGANRLTGRRETYGINIFKVREVIRPPAVTVAPDMPQGVVGMISMRGLLVPVIDLAAFGQIQSDSSGSLLIVTEYCNHVQAFLVDAVETILRLEWARMRVPPAMVASTTGGFVTAVTELPDKRLLLMLDVERVLADMSGGNDPYEAVAAAVAPVERKKAGLVYFCDDSMVARKQVRRTLDGMGLSYIEAVNGRETWDAIDAVAQRAIERRRPITDDIAIIITDVEMPEMDGYTLTRRIKADRRFDRVPVIMHSSLSANPNPDIAYALGVDDYVSKLDTKRFVEVLRKHLAEFIAAPG